MRDLIAHLDRDPDPASAVTTLDPPGPQLGAALFRLGSRLFRRSADLAVSEGLDPIDAEALFAMDRPTGAGLAQLAALLGHGPTSARAIAGLLVRAGLAEPVVEAAGPDGAVGTVGTVGTVTDADDVRYRTTLAGHATCTRIAAGLVDVVAGSGPDGPAAGLQDAVAALAAAGASAADAPTAVAAAGCAASAGTPAA